MPTQSRKEYLEFLLSEINKIPSGEATGLTITTTYNPWYGGTHFTNQLIESNRRSMGFKKRDEPAQRALIVGTIDVFSHTKERRMGSRIFLYKVFYNL